VGVENLVCPPGVSKIVHNATIDRMKKDTLKDCADFIRVYAECAQANGVAVLWRCRGELKEMNACGFKRNTQEKYEETQAIVAEEMREKREQRLREQEKTT